MRRVVCEEFGPLENLAIVEAPDPEPGAGEVLIRVRAAGVNFVDGLLVQGLYQIKPPLPFTPGAEVAGEVAAVGPGVEDLAVGDRVLAASFFGGFTDVLAVPARVVRRLPASLSFGQGAALVQSYATALFALTRRCRPAKGDWVLVLGAGGGVGLASVDVAHHLGARVIAAASSTAKLAAAAKCGAEAGIDYEREDLKARVREISSGGVHFVVDPVGGAYADAALRALRPFGQYLVLGFAAGSIPSLRANLILLSNRAVVGVDWGAWSMQNHEENAALLGEMLALVEAGALHPLEPTAYPLSRAREALADLHARRIAGKVVLVPDA